MSIEAERIDKLNKRNEVDDFYKIKIPKFMKDIKGVIFELPPQYIEINRAQIRAKIDELSIQLRACEDADKIEDNLIAEAAVAVDNSNNITP